MKYWRNLEIFANKKKKLGRSSEFRDFLTPKSTDRKRNKKNNRNKNKHEMFIEHLKFSSAYIFHVNYFFSGKTTKINPLKMRFETTHPFF